MQRILVIGIPGAGKSTLSRQLAAALGLPLVHLDQLFWGAGWIQKPEAEYRRAEDEALAGNAWVIDGNFVSTLTHRLKRADLVVYLDFPTGICLWRILKRTISNYGRDRDDMSAGCPERFDWEFFVYILRFGSNVRPKVEAKLKTKEGKGIVRLRSSREVARWIETVGSTPG